MAKEKSLDIKKADNASNNKEAWEKFHDIADDKMYEAMTEVRDFFERSRNYLRSSCYWDAYQEDSSGAVIAGGSWYERWNIQEKMALMWYRKPNSEDFISNIKSPMARGRINTFVNWMKKVNLEFGAKPNNKDDRNAAIMAEKVLNYWLENSNAKLALGDAWEDLAIHGNAFLKVSYVKESKEARFPKVKDLSKEEKEALDKGDRKLVFGGKEKIQISDDVVVEHVPIREAFPDPQARSLHGDTYRAGKFGRCRYVTLDYVKQAYGDHPNVKYIDKVKGSMAYKNLTDYFFEPPTDYQNDDIVELMELEDQDNDKFWVVANDICIIGYDNDEPLPSNHKEISYHKLDFIRVPGQLFSIGICDLLENIQASYEVALNMVADYVYRTYNYRLLIESDNYGEIKQALQRTGDMFIPIDASDGKPLTSKVMPLPNSQIGFDIFTFLDLLEKNATLATNVDPAQMALLAGSKTATSDILNKELLMTMIGGVVENNIQGDLRQVGRQAWKLMQQHYKVKKVKKIIGEDKKEKDKLVPRTIRFDGIELQINQDTGILEEHEIEGDYSFFELTDEYLNTKDEVDVFIKSESAEVQSQALEEQRISEEFAQLAPFMVDPNNATQVMNHPMPMIDANKWFREYFYVKRLPVDLLINQNKDTSQAVKTAEDHVMKILADESAPAIPGQSSAHLEYEYQVLDALIFKAEELSKAMEKEMATQFNQMLTQMQQMYPQDPYTGQFVDPMTGQPVEPPTPQPNPDKLAQLESVESKIEALEKHIMIEAMPAAMRNSRIATINSTGMNGQGGQPPMQTPAPEGAGAPPIDPSMITNPNPAGVPMQGMGMGQGMGGQGMAQAGMMPMV